MNTKEARALIQEAKDFRGGSIEGNYLDSRLARALEEILKYGHAEAYKRV